MSKLKAYQVQVRDGIWLTMRLSPEHANRATPGRIRDVPAKSRPATTKARTPANKGS